MENVVFQLCNIIMKMEKEIKELKSRIKVDPNLGLGEIIKNDNEKKLLINEIEKKLNKKVVGTKLLFSTKTDGDESPIFHAYCDNIPNILTLIKAENGRRFGGFANLTWSSSSEGIHKDDQNCFLFSLDNMEIYPHT